MRELVGWIDGGDNQMRIKETGERVGSSRLFVALDEDIPLMCSLMNKRVRVVIEDGVCTCPVDSFGVPALHGCQVGTPDQLAPLPPNCSPLLGFRQAMVGLQEPHYLDDDNILFARHEKVGDYETKYWQRLRRTENGWEDVPKAEVVEDDNSYDKLDAILAEANGTEETAGDGVVPDDETWRDRPDESPEPFSTRVPFASVFETRESVEALWLKHRKEALIAISENPNHPKQAAAARLLSYGPENGYGESGEAEKLTDAPQSETWRDRPSLL